MAIKHVHEKTTSLNGCKVDIDGDIVYSLIPLRISGFHGNVHISEGTGCSGGDLYFGIEPEVRKVKEAVPTPPIAEQ